MIDAESSQDGERLVGRIVLSAKFQRVVGRACGPVLAGHLSRGGESRGSGFQKMTAAHGSVPLTDIRIVLQNFGGRHEDVFVHQGDPEMCRLEGSPRCVDVGHPA